MLRLCSHARSRRPESISTAPPTAAASPCACGTPGAAAGPRRVSARHHQPRRLVQPAVANTWPRAASTSTSSTAAAPGSTSTLPGDVDRWQTWLDDVAVVLGTRSARAADRPVRHQLGRQASGRGSPAASRLDSRPGSHLPRTLFTPRAGPRQAAGARGPGAAPPPAAALADSARSQRRSSPITPAGRGSSPPIRSRSAK